MHQHDLARMLVKIAGLVIVVFAVIGLPQNIVTVVAVLSFSNRAGLPSLGQAIAMPQFWGMSFAPFAAYLAIGLGLIWWSGTISDRVIVRRDPKDIPGSADYRGLEEAAVAVLGAYLCADGLADAARWVGAAGGQALQQHLPIARYLWGWQVGTAIGALMRIVLGAALMAGNQGFVAFRRRMSLRSTES